MPVRDRQLTGDDSGADIVTVFEYFQEIMPFLVIEGPKIPVINDEELCSGQGGEHSAITAIDSGDTEFLKV